MSRKKILFATDLTEGNRQAFQLASAIAEAWKAKLLITYVNNSRSSSTSKDRPNENAAQLIYDIKPKDLAIEYDHLVRNGDPADVICEIEKQHDIDLIVLGTHGRKGIERIIAGSVAEKVLRSAICPVLTLRQRKSKRETRNRNSIRKILVPTDFSVHSYAALDFASSLAIAINAGITILHIDETTSAAKPKFANGSPGFSKHRHRLWERLKKFRPSESKVHHGHKLLGGPAARQITEYANEQGYEFIVLGTHGRTGIRRVLMGSVAEQVIRNADCAVITVKPSNKRQFVSNV